MVQRLNPAAPKVETRVQESARTGLEVCVTQPVSVCVCPTKLKPKTTNQQKPKTTNKPNKQTNEHNKTKQKPKTHNQTNTCVALRCVAWFVAIAEFAVNFRRGPNLIFNNSRNIIWWKKKRSFSGNCCISGIRLFENGKCHLFRAFFSRKHLRCCLFFAK